MDDKLEAKMQKEPLDLIGVKAAIFDMDGTMINNMAYHKKAWIEFCRRHGLDLTEEEFKERFSGKKNDQILSTIFGRGLTAGEVSKYAAEKEGVYQELYRPDIREVEGLRDLISQLKERGIRLAIATTAPETNRRFGLEALGLGAEFEVILGDEHVSRGKPDPQIYLETANRLGLDPSQCIVFEDSPPGVESGKAAGMRVIGILTSHTPDDLSKADMHVKDFSQLELV